MKHCIQVSKYPQVLNNDCDLTTVETRENIQLVNYSYIIPVPVASTALILKAVIILLLFHCLVFLLKRVGVYIWFLFIKAVFSFFC